MGTGDTKKGVGRLKEQDNKSISLDDSKEDIPESNIERYSLKEFLEDLRMEQQETA